MDSVSKYNSNCYEFQSTSFRSDGELRYLLHTIQAYTLRTRERTVRRFLKSIYELEKSILKAEKKNMPCNVLLEILKNLIRSALRKLCLHLERDCRPLLALTRIQPAGQAGILHFLLYEELSVLSLISPSPHSESEDFLESAYNVFFALDVLSIVYQYLIGYIDRGGTKTYNSGSLEFRATYVSLLLFQGAYVWIKFRDVAPKRTVYPRSRTNRSGGLECKYEPRFKPPREKDVVTGEVLKFECVSLGAYDTRQDAKVVCQIAGYYYGKDVSVVELDDGSQFRIPQMSEQEGSLCGEKKRKWVSVKAKQVYEEFKRVADARRQSRSSTLSADAGEQVGAGDYDFADPAVACLTADTNTEDKIAEFRSEPPQGDGSMAISDAGNVDDNLDVDWSFLDELEGIPTMQDISVQPQLDLPKEQVEAEFCRRFEEQQQQHLQHLEEQKVEMRRELEAEFNEQTAELRRENEEMKIALNQVIQVLNRLVSTSRPVLSSDVG